MPFWQQSKFAFFKNAIRGHLFEFLSRPQALRNVYNPTHHNTTATCCGLLETIPADQNISFLWIPGHDSIPRETKADGLAKRALNETEPVTIKYLVDDYKAIYNSTSNSIDSTHGTSQGGSCKSTTSNPNCGPGYSSGKIRDKKNLCSTD